MRRPATHIIGRWEIGSPRSTEKGVRPLQGTTPFSDVALVLAGVAVEEVRVVLFGELRSADGEREVHGRQLRVLAEFRANGREYDIVVEIHGSPCSAGPPPRARLGRKCEAFVCEHRKPGVKDTLKRVNMPLR